MTKNHLPSLAFCTLCTMTLLVVMAITPRGPAPAGPDEAPLPGRTTASRSSATGLPTAIVKCEQGARARAGETTTAGSTTDGILEQGSAQVKAALRTEELPTLNWTSTLTTFQSPRSSVLDPTDVEHLPHKRKSDGKNILLSASPSSVPNCTTLPGAVQL